MAFILHVCHIGPLTHIGTNLCLPKKETAGKSNSYAVLSKMIIKCEEWEQLRLCQHIRLLNEMGLQCGNLPSVSQYRFALLPQRMAFNRLGWEMRKKVWVCQSQAPPPPLSDFWTMWCDGDVGGRVHRKASDGFVSNYSQRGADRRSALAAAMIKWHFLCSSCILAVPDWRDVSVSVHCSMTLPVHSIWPLQIAAASVIHNLQLLRSHYMFLNHC